MKDFCIRKNAPSQFALVVSALYLFPRMKDVFNRGSFQDFDAVGDNATRIRGEIIMVMFWMKLIFIWISLWILNCKNVIVAPHSSYYATSSIIFLFEVLEQIDFWRSKICSRTGFSNPPSFLQYFPVYPFCHLDLLLKDPFMHSEFHVKYRVNNYFSLDTM